MNEIMEIRQQVRLNQWSAMVNIAVSLNTCSISSAIFSKAVNYLIEEDPYLRRYIEDGRLEVDNNRAERSIKPFVIGRKNWLFANTPSGAKASATAFSVIETAKENDLDPYEYLKFIFTKAPNLKDNESIDILLPWNAPDDCCSKSACSTE